MAHLHSGILGPISGKVGNMVFYRLRGKGFVRSMPHPSNKAATEKQLIQRARFGLASKFLSPVATVINDCNRYVRKMTAGNKALRQILSEAVVGNYPNFRIDYSKVELLRGNLGYPHAKMLPCSSLGQLALCWMRPYELNANPDDELQIMVYCPELSRWYVPESQILREDLACFVQIPAAFQNREIHVWTAFRSKDHRTCSSSQYLGKAEIALLYAL